MTTRDTMQDRGALRASATYGQAGAGQAIGLDAELPHRNMSADQDEMIWDYAAIERRAQELRSEAAWNMARAIREWAAKLFGQGKAKARAVAQSSLERHGQAT